MKKHETYFLIFLPVLLLVAGSVLAVPENGGQKNVTDCGTVLTEPGSYKLVNDLLACPEHGIKITGSDIDLNLKGHEISCANDWIGVFLMGSSETTVKNVTVRNGHVSNCFDGIGLWYAEDSKVMNMSSTDNYEAGIALWSSQNNVIMHNDVRGSAIDGIYSWSSSGNLFKHNTSIGNGNGWEGAGMSLEGENNSRIMCNRVHGNADGILLHTGGSGNLIRGNLVSGNVTGIEMLGFYWQDPDSGQEYYYGMPSGNTIRSNIAESHSWVDLYEAYWDFGSELLPNPDGICRNTWEKNQFQTEIGVAGCIGIPVALDEEDVCALGNDDD